MTSLPGARRSLFGAALLLCFSALGRAAAPPYIDVLNQPALASPLAARTLVNGVVRAGARLVAVGQRGHILYSDDHGVRWTQARVPVSADLVALHFPTPAQGWAVGHDGVVLHSADGGASWRAQLDGRAVVAILQRSYDHDGVDAALRKEVTRLIAQGPDQPLLDVWFDDPRSGFVVGAFGLVFHTDDGGATWQPWLDRVANPKAFHLNAVRSVDGATYIAGEQGLLLKLGAGGKRFDALATPYQGSYFGLIGGPGLLLAYGLRGNAWRSADQGRNWIKVDTGLQGSISAAATLPDGRVVLVGQGGQVLLSADQGVSFQAVPHVAPGPVAAVVADEAGLVLGGPRGLRPQALPQ